MIPVPVEEGVCMGQIEVLELQHRMRPPGHHRGYKLVQNLYYTTLGSCLECHTASRVCLERHTQHLYHTTFRIVTLLEWSDRHASCQYGDRLECHCCHSHIWSKQDGVCSV